MAKIVKHITLSVGSAATTSTSYAYQTAASVPFTWDADAYDGSLTIYFEATLYTSAAGGTAYVCLQNGSGTQVTGSEISTTASVASGTRVRSGAIALVDDTVYRIAVKSNNASYTARLLDARLVIVQDGVSAKTRTVINLASNSTTTSTAYIDHGETGVFRYTAAEWGGTKTVYFEAVLKTNNASGTAYVVLTDLSNNQVTSSELSTSASVDRNVVRSAAIVLVDGTDYKVRFKSNNASYTTTCIVARIIIDQTVNALPTCLYAGAAKYGSSSSTTYTGMSSFIYHDDAEWDTVTNTVLLGGNLIISNSAATAWMSVYGASHQGETSSTTTVANFSEGSPFTPVDDTNYRFYIKTSNASYSVQARNPWMIYKSAIPGTSRRVFLIS